MQLSVLRCLQLGPPHAASAGAACFTGGTWWVLSRMLEACAQLEVAHLWGATDEQAGAWAADLDGMRSGRGPQAASLSCTRMAAPGTGLHVRLSRLPGCVRHALPSLSASPKALGAFNQQALRYLITELMLTVRTMRKQPGSM